MSLCLPACLSVCLSMSVCVSPSISPEPLVQTLPNCVFVWLWLGPPQAALRYTMYFRFYAWTTSYLHITAANKHIQQVYSKLLNRGQHGFDTEAYSRADPPRGSIKAGQCLISDISLIKMFISPRFWQMTYRLGEKVDFDGISTSLEQIVNSRCRSRDVM